MKLKKLHFTPFPLVFRQWRFLFAGVLFLPLLSVVFFTTKPIAADTLDVTATVPAPLPTEPASFTSPPNNTRFPSPIITLEGTCPQNGAYVAIYRDGSPIGTAPCNNGSFTMTVSLVPGENQFIAHVYNVTNGEGPVSAPLTLFYDVPNVPEKPPLSPFEPLPQLTPQPSPGSGNPLVLWYDYHYQVRTEGQPWSWEIHISGGTPPYSIRIDWGDGKTETLSLTGGTSFTLTHTYTSAGTYTPVIRALDNTGQQAALQLLAVVSSAAIDETPSATKRERKEEGIPLSFVVTTPLAIVLVAAIVKAWFASSLSPTIKGGKKP